MANTFTQIHLQIIFAVQNRISLIAPSWEEELYKDVTGIVHNNDHKLLAVMVYPTTFTCSLECGQRRRYLLSCRQSNATHPGGSTKTDLQNVIVDQ
jgi:hypothetical protein